jgi:hypothetical protein
MMSPLETKTILDNAIRIVQDLNAVIDDLCTDCMKVIKESISEEITNQNQRMEI